MNTPETMKPTRARKPRPWKPSARDQAIYRAVVIEGRTQLAAGEQFGRSQSAVSRLLKRFERWRGGAKPEVSGDLDSVRQKHFDRWLARQRHDEIYTRAMRLAQRMEEQPATTHRAGQRGETAWKEEIQRDQLAAAGQMLKTALRANEALDRFPDKKPLPHLPEGDPEIDEHRLDRDLHRLRQAAEKAGVVPKSEDVFWTVQSWKHALIGEWQGIALPREYEPGSPRSELAKAVLSGGATPEMLSQRLRAAADAVLPQAGQEPGIRDHESGDMDQEPAWSAATASQLPQASAMPIESPPVPTDNCPLTADIPPHKTHTRIFVGGHPPLAPREGEEAVTPEPPKRWDPCRGGGRVVMIDPSTGKKFGAHADEYANDPLGQLYRRIEERRKQEARDAAWRASW